MKAPTAIVAEDEPVLRAELVEMLGEQWPELAIVATAADGDAAAQAVDRAPPDILFLDIEMPGASGLEVARRASGRCHVVFVTAYDKYAVAAFEEGAVDYVVKPLLPARLDATIARLKQRLAQPPADLTGLLQSLAATLSRRKDYLRWITASQGSELRLITVEEICYFEADNKYTLVVTAQQQSLIRRPIKELIDELDPRVFWQIHRGTVVNVNAVAGVTRDMGGHLRVKLKERKETLAVSEPYRHLFRQM